MGDVCPPVPAAVAGAAGGGGADAGGAGRDCGCCDLEKAVGKE